MESKKEGQVLFSAFIIIALAGMMANVGPTGMQVTDDLSNKPLYTDNIYHFLKNIESNPSRTAIRLGSNVDSESIKIIGELAAKYGITDTKTLSTLNEIPEEWKSKLIISFDLDQSADKKDSSTLDTKYERMNIWGNPRPIVDIMNNFESYKEELDTNEVTLTEGKINVIISCVDSDGGSNTEIKGFVTGSLPNQKPSRITGPGYQKDAQEFWDKDYTEIHDYCVKENTAIVEGFCIMDETIQQKEYPCEYGCEDGACLTEPIIEEEPFVIDGPLEHIDESKLAPGCYDEDDFLMWMKGNNPKPRTCIMVYEESQDVVYEWGSTNDRNYAKANEKYDTNIEHYYDHCISPGSTQLNICFCLDEELMSGSRMCEFGCMDGMCLQEPEEEIVEEESILEEQTEQPIVEDKDIVEEFKDPEVTIEEFNNLKGGKIVIGKNAKASDNVASIPIAGEYKISILTDEEKEEWQGEKIYAIGGPAVNKLTASLMGDWSYQSGEAIIAVYIGSGGETIIVIAGTTAEDTVNAVEFYRTHPDPDTITPGVRRV